MELMTGRKVNKQSKKLAKLLGEDSFASINLPTVPPPASAATIEKAWYLGEDYDPDDIVFDEKGNVKAGTLKALVARLTPHGSTGGFSLLSGSTVGQG